MTKGYGTALLKLPLKVQIGQKDDKVGNKLKMPLLSSSQKKKKKDTFLLS
jgi:ribosome assembly protein YihI (activator of Der GTPase)